MKRLAVDLDESLHRQLKALAARKDTSMSDIVRDLIISRIRSESGGNSSPVEIPEGARAIQDIVHGVSVGIRRGHVLGTQEDESD